MKWDETNQEVWAIQLSIQQKDGCQSEGLLEGLTEAEGGATNQTSLSHQEATDQEGEGL